MNVKTTNRETNILYFRHVYMYYALTLRTTEEPKETSPDTFKAVEFDYTRDGLKPAQEIRHLLQRCTE